MKNLGLTKWVLGSMISLLAAVIALLLGLTSVFENLELKSYDLRFALRGEKQADDNDIVIVAIDEFSFFDLPHRWPFPRRYYAKLIDNLTRAGARLIVFDITFSEPSEDLKDDRLLALAAKRSGRVIFAGKIGHEKSNNGTLSTYVIKPVKTLLKSGSPWAFVNIDEDPDGFVRRYLLFESTNDRKYLPLAVRAYLSVRKGQVEIDHSPNGDLRFNGKTVPTYDFNSFLINYRGPAKTFTTYSLSNVLDDKDFDLADKELDTDSFEEQFLRSGVFKDKIVFVGASAEELQDTRLTPFFSKGHEKRKMPGVEIHANALSTLLNRDFFRRTSLFIEILLIVTVAFLTMGLVLSANVLGGILSTGLEILLLLFASFVLFSVTNIWIPLVAPVVAILLSYAGNSAHVIVSERRERRRTKKVFEQYVSENVVSSILASGTMPKFGGEKLALTVLFSDIRAFTTFCEKHAPETVVNRLNEYLTEMVDVIFHQQGTLDKFVGDAIMALFGAPVYYPDHAEKACMTACEMMERLHKIQKRWAEREQDYFDIGIGINSGTMIVGNLGAQQRFDYTVIGDEVNLGARLEGANKQYGTSIIISESTYKQVKKNARARELDLVKVKGKTKPVKIYELLSMKPLPQNEDKFLLDVYTQGLQNYRERKWYPALKKFNQVLKYFPSDGPTRVYITRCLEFLETPPPVDWDGVYEFKTK